MASITVHFKDGTSRAFAHEGRAGGSYTKRLRYEGAFAVISDEWGRETAFPAADIREIIKTERREW